MLGKILLGVSLFVSTSLLAADPVELVPKRIDAGPIGGIKVFNESLVVPQFTGWYPVSDASEIVFEVLWDDAAGSVTEIEMQCWTARDSLSFGSGSGYQLTTPVNVLPNGKVIYKQERFSFPFTEGDVAFSFTVKLPAAKFLQCGFYAASGVSAASDKLSVYSRGATP